MANQLPELHISLKYGLTNHMQSKYRGVILVPTNQYLQTKFLKKCKKCTCHESCVLPILSAGGCLVLFGWVFLVVVGLFVCFF